MFVIIVGLFACLLASCLLLDLRNVFYGDWNNHLWYIEYFGACFKHWTFPVVINTNQFVGMPNPLFYAGKFYALTGFLSAFLGSAIAVRIMIFTVLVLQFFGVYRAAKQAGSDQKISMSIAVMVTWAIYPLTNLYNRGDLPEFFSVAFLTCSVCSFLYVVLKGPQQASFYDKITTGLFFVAAAATHPLTALFGGVFLGVLGLIVLCFCEKRNRLGLLKIFLITALFCGLILSPWIYLLHQFYDKLTIKSVSAGYFTGGGFNPASIDNVLSRLSPLPLDLRLVHCGIHDIPDPYLDAQISLPLVLLIGVFIYVRLCDKSKKYSLSALEGAIIWGSAVMFLVALLASVYPKVSGWFGGFFDILQFPYRLVTYVNLSALVMLIVLAGAVSRAGITSPKLINVCLAFCIALSLFAVILKLVHASAVMLKSTDRKAWMTDTGKIIEGMLWAPLPFGSNSHLNELPKTIATGTGDYYVEDGFLTVLSSKDIPVIYRPFSVLEGRQFGQVEALTINLTKRSLVVTSVEPFPWNQIVVDGVLQSRSNRLLDVARQAVLLPQGSHRLEFVVQVDPLWRRLNFLSWVLFIGWMVVYMVCVLAKLSQRGFII